jgi:N-methylhydantoinase A
MIRIGIDIGGTFTDFTIWRGETAGYTAVDNFKVPSSPPQFAEAVKVGVRRLLESRLVSPEDEVVLVHGTTVSTNAVIERSGPKLALLTTEGFRDVLQLQRLRLERPTDMFNERPTPLIPRSMVFEISERMEPDGSVLRSLRAEQVVGAAKDAIEKGAAAIAVSFLHSFRNPAHELAARDAIRVAGLDIDVILSSEVWAQQGEYERTVAATLNAYVQRIMSDYIGEIEGFLAERLPRARLFITRSNGGVMSASEARSLPIHTLLSGPSAGVTAAQFLGSTLAVDKILTMDMGGTSTDLALIWEGRPRVTTQAAVGDFPLMMPVTGIEAIGAGGGSIASMQGAVLTVGPRSAGSRPGPACYNRGGTEPTLSDAYLLCGYIDPDLFLGGAMPLRKDLAETAMQPIAQALCRDHVSAAEACIEIATSNMVASVLPYLARVGVDPKELTLLVYGGAGAIHGPLLAEEVGIERILVPRMPSVFCAFGGLVSDLIHDVVRSVHGVAVTPRLLQDGFRTLVAEAQDWLNQQIEGRFLINREFQYYAEMRYRGQSFQVDVPLEFGAIEAVDLSSAEASFHAEHERLFNYRSEAPVEFVSVRVRVVGQLRTPPAIPNDGTDQLAEEARIGTRAIRLNRTSFDDTPVYRRDKLGTGVRVNGPAIIEQGDATVLVPNQFNAEVGPYGDLVLTRGN